MVSARINMGPASEHRPKTGYLAFRRAERVYSAPMVNRYKGETVSRFSVGV